MIVDRVDLKCGGSAYLTGHGWAYPGSVEAESTFRNGRVGGEEGALVLFTRHVGLPRFGMNGEEPFRARCWVPQHHDEGEALSFA